MSAVAVEESTREVETDGMAKLKVSTHDCVGSATASRMPDTLGLVSSYLEFADSPASGDGFQCSRLTDEPHFMERFPHVAVFNSSVVGDMRPLDNRLTRKTPPD